MAGSDIAAQRAQRAAVCVFHPGYMGQLFPALLSYVLLLRLHGRTGSGMRPYNFHRGQHRRDSAHAQRCRTVALCREDDADTLRRGFGQRTVLRPHRPHGADNACRAARRVQLGGSGLYTAHDGWAADAPGCTAIKGNIFINLKQIYYERNHES